MFLRIRRSVTGVEIKRRSDLIRHIKNKHELNKSEELFVSQRR